MNQRFYFSSVQTPGWFYWLSLPLVYFYFLLAGKIIYYLKIGETQYLSVAVYLFTLYICFTISNLPVEYILKFTSFLEINNNSLNLYIFSRLRWSIPIGAIEEMDIKQGNPSLTSDFSELFMSRGSLSSNGFMVLSKGKYYEQRHFLANYEGFKQQLLALNPDIKFGALTEKANEEFKREDLGKLIEQKANGNLILQNIGRFISKITFASALYVGLIITFILIVWLALAT